MKAITRMLPMLLIAVLAACGNDEPHYMTLSDKNVSVVAESETVTMTVWANVHYTVTHETTWFHITETSTEGRLTTFTIDVNPNEAYEARTGRIKFIGEGVTPKALDITQRGVVPTGVSVRSILVPSDATSAVFSVIGEGEWTATASNPDYTVTPASGEGPAEVTVTFPANRSGNEVKGLVSVAMGGKNYTVTVIQQAVDLSLITEWAIKANASVYANTWGNDNFDKGVEGFIKSYAAPTSGTGSIRFYNSDKSARKDDGKGFRTQTGSNGDLLIRGIVKGDWLLVECGNDMLDEIPAGKEMRFEFTGHIYLNAAGYWMLEYLDGGQWKPLGATQTATATATEGISGDAGNWSETFDYNISYPADGVYVTFANTFVLENPCAKVQIRLRPATDIAICGKYIDKIPQNTCTRFSAQHANEGTLAVKEYNQTVKLEFVK